MAADVDTTADPRIQAVESLLRRFAQPLYPGHLGWGASVVEILATADAVDPARSRSWRVRRRARRWSR